MVKAFILAELSLNYDNGYLDTLPVEFLHVKPDRVATAVTGTEVGN